ADSRRRCSSKVRTTAWSTRPVASSSSSFWSRLVRSFGADSGRTTWAGCRSKVTRAVGSPRSAALSRTSRSSARWPRWTPTSSPVSTPDPAGGSGQASRLVTTCTTPFYPLDPVARTTSGRAEARPLWYRARSRPSGPRTARGPESPAGEGGDREHGAVGDRPGGLAVDLDPAQVAHGLGQRQERLIGVLGDLLQRPGLLDGEGPHPEAPQPGQVGAAPEGFAEVGGQAADVGTAAALDQQLRPGELAGREGLDGDALDVHRPGGPFDDLTLAGQLVQAAPLDLDRRHHRRDLLDGAEE